MIRTDYQCEFARTEEEAKRRCDEINAGYTYYMRKTAPAHYTTCGHMYLVWFKW